MSVHDSESCLENVFWPDLFLVVTQTQIYFEENLNTLQLVKKVINSWEGVFALDRNLIQSSVINTQS